MEEPYSVSGTTHHPTESRRLLVLIVVMALVTTGAVATTFFGLYRTALEQQRQRLAEIAQSQARMVEAIALQLQESGENSETVLAMTLAPLRDAHTRFEGFGQTGEFTLARREANRMVFLLRHRHSTVTSPEPVPFESGLAEPMRRALSGESGVFVSADYRGERVLAAYEPVTGLDLGVVAKVDLAEIRAPFIRTGVRVVGVGLILILTGALLFLRIGEPMLRMLRQRERKFRGIFEDSRDAILHLTVDGDVVETNRAARDLFGFRRDELAALNARDLDANPDDGCWFRESPAAEGSVKDCEVRCRKKDGTEIDCLVTSTPQRSRDGVVTDYFTIIRDVTQQKRAEESRNKAEREAAALAARNEALLAAVPDIIMEVDNEKEYAWANQPGIEFFGDDVIGREASEYFVGEQDAYQRVVPLFEGDEDVICVDSWQSRKDGESRLLAWTCRVLKDANGKVIGALSSARDVTDQHEAVVALLESEARYKALFETMAQGVVYQDAAGRITSCNAAAEMILGASLDQMQGRTSLDPKWRAVHEDGSDFLGDTHPSMVALQTGERVTNTVMGVFNPHQGGYRWININAVPEFEVGEVTPYQVYTTFEDITKRMAVERELRDREALLSSILRAAPIGIGVVQDRVVQQVNRRLCEMLGYVEAELVGKNARVVYPSDEEYEFVGSEKYRQITESGVGTVETKFRRKDGQIIDVLLSSAPLEPNHLSARVTFTALDITERKQAEEGLRWLSKVAEQVGEGVATADLGGNLIFVNRAWAEMHGYEPEELIGKPLSIFHADEQITEVHAFNEKVLKNGQHSGEVGHVRRDGTCFPTQMTTTLLRDDNGQALGLIGVASDITGRERARQVLHDSQDQLHALAARLHDVREEERIQIARNLHDGLGQRLTGLRMDLDAVALRLPQASENLKVDMTSLMDMVDECIRETQDMSVDLRPPMLDVLGLSAATDWFVSDFGDRSGLSSEVSVPPCEPLLDVRCATAIFRILQESLTNVARHAEADHVRVALREEQGIAMLEIYDDGVGITEEQLTDASSLGLLGMRERAAALGGTLEIASCPEGGTRVELKVPVAAPERARGSDNRGPAS